MNILRISSEALIGWRPTSKHIAVPPQALSTRKISRGFRLLCMYMYIYIYIYIYNPRNTVKLYTGFYQKPLALSQCI